MIATSYQWSARARSENSTRCGWPVALARRTAAISAGDIELDRERRRVFRAGREIALGPTEFRLLEYLIQSPGRVYSREQLLDGVWGTDVYVEDRTVDVHIGRVRKALSQASESDPIRTVRGSGYAFDERYQK